MPECETCGTVHGVVARVVDEDVKHFCVHDAKGEPIEDRHRVVEYPDRR